MNMKATTSIHPTVGLLDTRERAMRCIFSVCDAGFLVMMFGRVVAEMRKRSSGLN
ncbi:hypothetical protein BDN70DRAFT_873939 [Pholiota conissans]|uniref:Uncharacterized protein n=1 Tax=Pholiota conissans TaxID=109636 RepID=A0A9P6D4U7_9AGAR|nr:hypothetical protein BDN70DRAFT_873939 [Pholiota conissans]